MAANLFAARALDGNSSSIKFPRNKSQSNVVTAYAYGTWDGATLKFQISHDDTNWFDVTNGSFTANGYITFTTSASYIRAALSNDGATTNLNAHVE